MTYTWTLAPGSVLGQGETGWVYIDVDGVEAQPVAVAVTRPATQPETWTGGEWVNEDTQVRFQVGPEAPMGALEPGKHKVWVWVPGDASLPAQDAFGFLFITE